MKVIDILEELEDFKDEKDLIHYTNLVGLFGILRSRKIKSQSYSVSSSDRVLGVSEISTMRKSLKSRVEKNEDDMASLTYKSDGVKIHLDSKKILASVRGIKKNPISEFSKSENERLSSLIRSSLYGKDIDRRKFMFDFKKIAEKNLKLDREGKKIEETFEGRREMTTFIKKYDVDENVFLSMLTLYRSIAIKQAKRIEGEERFSFKYSKEEKGIPLNKEYLEIELTRDFSFADIRKVYRHMGGKDINDIKILFNFIVINKNLFKMNKYYDNLKRVLEKYIEQYRYDVLLR